MTTSTGTTHPGPLHGPRGQGLLTSEQLRVLAAAGEVDTVVVAFPDLQGRLVGKRVSARLYLEEVAAHGAECCDYLLAVDVENDTVAGYATSSWETGYGDVVMRPDPATLRRIPWLPGTALVIADVLRTDGAPVRQAPRHVLTTQVQRLAERGLVALAGTELEFIVFEDTYADAWAARYQGLRAASTYNIDYSVLGSTRMEPLVRAIRLGMEGAGMYVEGSKGECHLGQQEIGFRYDDARITADQHVIYKNGAKEIADAHGKSLTFMAKYDEREGNSCHVHLSLRSADGDAVLADPSRPHGFSPLMEHVIAGQLATVREMALLLAPNINSYKRFAEGSFAPTSVAWGLDNRTCALRVVGAGSSLRVENRVPGGDVNPHLAIAALIAGALHGVEHELELPPPTRGNAYTSDAVRVPTTLREAADLFEGSRAARAALGDDVVDHYANTARVELAAFEAAVTDWERVRGFERL